MQASNFGDLYKTVIKTVLRDGVKRHVRGFKTKELLCQTLVLTNPKDCLLTTPSRKLNEAFQVGEMVWILTGNDDLAQISYYNKNMAKFSDDGHVLAGAYGPRIHMQKRYIIDLLKKDPDTRQAVLTIWSPSPKPSKDIPCTVMMHFLKNEMGDLDLIVYMRSNDIFLGLPYDISTFCCFLMLVAHEVGLSVGSYYHVAGSLHAYEHDFDKLEKIADDAPSSRCWPEIGECGFGFLGLLDQLRSMEKNIRLGTTYPYDWPKSPFMDYCKRVLTKWREKKYANSLK